MLRRRRALQVALNCRARRVLAQRSRYDDLTHRLRSSDEPRPRWSANSIRCARHHRIQLKEQAARLVSSNMPSCCFLTRGRSAGGPGVHRVRQCPHQRAGEIDRIQRDIHALGAVNLATLDELGIARERKQFRCAASHDLNEAMTTLEDAIRKIDMETRDGFQHV
jgi:chromosome segregation protein